MSDMDHLREIGRLRAALENVQRKTLDAVFAKGPQPDATYTFAVINKIAREALEAKP